MGGQLYRTFFTRNQTLHLQLNCLRYCSFALKHQIQLREELEYGGHDAIVASIKFYFGNEQRKPHCSMSTRSGIFCNALRDLPCLYNWLSEITSC